MTIEEALEIHRAHDFQDYRKQASYVLENFQIEMYNRNKQPSELERYNRKKENHNG